MFKGFQRVNIVQLNSVNWCQRFRIFLLFLKTKENKLKWSPSRMFWHLRSRPWILSGCWLDAFCLVSGLLGFFSPEAGFVSGRQTRVGFCSESRSGRSDRWGCTEPPEMPQWILTLIMRRPAGLMAKKQTGQSKVPGDGAGPACPAGCDAQTAPLRSSWVLMKMNNRVSAADCSA